MHSESQNAGLCGFYFALLGIAIKYQLLYFFQNIAYLMFLPNVYGPIYEYVASATHGKVVSK